MKNIEVERKFLIELPSINVIRDESMPSSLAEIIDDIPGFVTIAENKYLIKDRYYDTEDYSFLKSGEILRVRNSNNKYEVTVKSQVNPGDNSKRYEENITLRRGRKLNLPDKYLDLLEAGKPVLMINNTRLEFTVKTARKNKLKASLDDAYFEKREFDFDGTVFIHAFCAQLEIELISGDNEYERCFDEIEKAVRGIGLKLVPCKESKYELGMRVLGAVNA